MKVLEKVLKLRQACCHPQVGGGEGVILWVRGCIRLHVCVRERERVRDEKVLKFRQACGHPQVEGGYC